VETPHQKDCSQGIPNLCKNLFSIQTWAFSTNIKLTLYKAPVRSVMTHACPTWEYAENGHLLKLQRLQN
jgi:hypothetical protein